jgi:activator of 2-hydroxyglutaryl-CoA dehydratase
MIVFIAIIMSIVFSGTALANKIYTWEDANGIVHFSDKPIKNAQTITLSKTHTQSKSAKTMKQSPLASAFVRFLNPIHEETLRNNSGNLSVQAIGNRPLSAPYSFQLHLDNAPYGKAQLENTWQLLNIDRGSHTLKLTLLKNQQVIATSPQITVYLHRARVKKAG